jgi:hypothetical protein
MSGGIVQLVATGAQDTWLTGKPEVSFFRSNYKRYTHYSSTVERQIIQGNPMAGGISTVRFEKKGDLLSYVYFTARDSSGVEVANQNWATVIDKVELLIGGQVIDTQDFEYMTDIEPVTGAQTFSTRFLNHSTSNVTSQRSSFFPLKFFFCKDWSVSLPLIALQFHDVELRVTWASALPALQYQAWANYVYLDQGERDYFAKTAHDLLITQVTRVNALNLASQELALAHPIKFIAFPTISYDQRYYAGTAANLQLKVQINGTDASEFRALPAYVDSPQYYNTPFGYSHNNAVANVAIVSYCLDTSKLQPTGTLNFSRLDTYRLVVPAALTGGVAALCGAPKYLYAVNYNVLRIQNGLGGLMYAN